MDGASFAEKNRRVEFVKRGRTLKEIFDSMRSRPRIKLPQGVTIKSLIEEGRRF
jgi:hypothetical protein